MMASLPSVPGQYQRLIDGRRRVAHSPMMHGAPSGNCARVGRQKYAPSDTFSFFVSPRSKEHHGRDTRIETLMRGKLSLVSVVDDDQSVRESLPDLLWEFGFAAEVFSSAEAFLESDVVSETRCLLLDVVMPGMSGPELQQELIRRRQEIPIVFMTALSDDSVRPRLLAEGAVDCLFKPFSETALLDALNAALGVR